MKNKRIIAIVAVVLFTIVYFVLEFSSDIKFLNIAKSFGALDGRAFLVALAKLLPTFSIFLILLFQAFKPRVGENDFSHGARLLPVLLALAFSMTGDIFGEMKSVFGDSAFLMQIAFFAVAQVFYCISFARHCCGRRQGVCGKGERALKIAGSALLACYLVAIAAIILNAIDSDILKVAVPVYLCVIGAMGFLCIGQKRPGQVWMVLGALSFIASDSVLAINAFVSRVPHSCLIIMTTYYLAQLLLNITLVEGRR